MTNIMEIRHLTARFAWHDSGWNGKICKNPSDNVYCRENYSLLSSRIQRRIDLSREEKYKEKNVCEIFTNESYTPPCYWCINAFGEGDCTVIDPHPFSDLDWMKELFKDVPPLEVELPSNTIYTWCFKLSFAEEGSPEGRYPADLEDRVEKYISKIVPGKSVVFFYANYSNPVTGDDYKRLLLGCAVVEEILPPKKFQIPPEILKKVRSGRGMQNFPEIAWQFGVKINPETAFVLPYHHYLTWIEDAQDDEEKDRRLKLLREVAVAIDEPTLQPLFKYVSMQFSTDQAIYLMYLLKRAAKKMKEHGRVPRDVIGDILEKIDRILSKLWKERGKYPGFRSAAAALLKYSFEESKEVANKVEELVLKTCGDISAYLEGKKEPKTEDVKLKRAINILNRKRNILKFLSLFDLSPKQMERVIEIIENVGLNTVKSNPYRILEEYNFEVVEHWDWDESDTRIDLYHIDIAILPDPEFADWYFEEFDPKSPHRIRAIISKLLLKAALSEGNTYLTRSEVLEKIKEYPLYYVGGELKIGEAELEQFERDPLFKEKFVIGEDPETGERIYQLSSIREIERKIEDFIKTMLKKTYQLSPRDESFISQAVRNECAIAVQKGILSEKEVSQMEKERKKLYRTSLSKGFTVISGGAGTGKTQAIANLVKYFRKTAKGRIFVLSPTGKSNIVIRKRLREMGLNPDSDELLKVSTIHRLLYGGLFEAIEDARKSLGKDYRETRYYREMREIRTLNNLISELLEGNFGKLRELWSFTRKYRFSNVHAVIIDEASMVDELTLTALLSLFDEHSLKHLILVGDERQLPPIGVGRPFSDVIFFLKRSDLEENIVYLRTNLRFPENSSLNVLSSIFASDESPAINEILQYCTHADDTLELRSFSDSEDLKKLLKEIFREIIEAENLDVTHKEDLFEILKGAFDEKGVDIIQILAPTRAGELGTWVINNKLILENRTSTLPGSKLICEENIYINVERRGRKRRVLGLANGSMLYLTEGNRIESEEIKEIFWNYGRNAGFDLIDKIQNDIFNPLSVDKRINLAYAITVHKSQGSDFDYVILVLNELTSFITRELMYTALTRAKKKLYLLVHNHLAEDLPAVFWKIHENSVNERLKTTLFTTKRSIFKPYILTLRNGEKVFLRSKIEYMIAKALDELGVKFEYEPRDFLDKGIKPDFKIVVDGNVYYWEHLGLLDKVSYRERWLKKLEVYKELGYEDYLITTTESEKPSEIEEKIRKIVEDLKSGNLQTTISGYPSKHHYEL